MAYTVQELTNELIDLGFEDDTITSEDNYGRIFINSVNRALDIVYSIVVPQISDYYRITGSWGYEADGEWTLPKPKHISESSQPDDKIIIADNLKPLIPLLAAHYIWLDDDITKATMYWNEYDQLKDQIISVCRMPRKAQIVGGIRW